MAAKNFLNLKSLLKAFYIFVINVIVSGFKKYDIITKCSAIWWSVGVTSMTNKSTRESHLVVTRRNVQKSALPLSAPPKIHYYCLATTIIFFRIYNARNTELCQILIISQLYHSQILYKNLLKLQNLLPSALIPNATNIHFRLKINLIVVCRNSPDSCRKQKCKIQKDET